MKNDVKLNIDDNTLAEIGKVAVMFSYLEHSLSEIITRVFMIGGCAREIGSIVTAELSFKQRISTLESLLLQLGKGTSSIAEFNRIKSLLIQAEESRNKVVHSVWAKPCSANSPHTVVRIKTTARQKVGLRIDTVPMEPEDLRAIVGTINKAYVELCVFETQFYENHDPE